MQECFIYDIYSSEAPQEGVYSLGLGQGWINEICIQGMN